MRSLDCSDKQMGNLRFCETPKNMTISRVQIMSALKVFFFPLFFLKCNSGKLQIFKKNCVHRNLLTEMFRCLDFE